MDYRNYASGINRSNTKVEVMNKKLVVLGGGESGVGAALLAKENGYEVFISDKGTISDKKVLTNRSNDTYIILLSIVNVISSFHMSV